MRLQTRNRRSPACSTFTTSVVFVLCSKLRFSPRPNLSPFPQLARALDESAEDVRRLLNQVIADCERPERGVFLRQIGTRYQMATKPEHHEFLQELRRGLRPPAPLSLPALETLAIIAYKQPISAPEIQAIRRVAGAGVLTTLLKHKLIATAGRKRDGKGALLYRTTELFLRDFGLQTLKDLRSLECFTEIRNSKYYSSTLRLIRKNLVSTQ